jgi:UDP-MurNAc hydroxylase
MRVRYIYSACVVIESPDVRIVCDPWFTPGAGDGSWYQWPIIDDPIKTISEVDLIYISHIHSDHYDPVFLRKYLRRFPSSKIIIGDQAPPLLQRKMELDGFGFNVVDALCVGDTDLFIVPNRSRKVNLDTALVVRCGTQSIVNLNDNPFDAQQVSTIRDLCGGSPTLALLPYGGATNHPQTFHYDSHDELLNAVKTKERHFLDCFKQYIDVLEPKAVLPFAGKYWLAGPLSVLNPYRGIPDAITAAVEVGERGFVLADGGDAYFDLNTMKPSAVRSTAYDLEEVSKHFAALDFPGYSYEREIRPDAQRQLPLLPLLNTALRSARRKINVTEPYWVCIQPATFPDYLCFDPSTTGDVVVLDSGQVSDLMPRLEIFIDDRYLFGLLTRLYHWNNAVGGSQFRSRRTPDVYRRDVADFIDVLQV